MLKHLMYALLMFVCGAALGCQAHTTALQQSTTRADEAAAISTLRTISLEQQTYAAGNNGSYGTFPQLVQAGFLDERYTSERPKVRGYVFVMTVTPSAYSINADPETSGPQGGRHLYLDSASGVIHVNASQPAGANDAALDQ